MFFQRKIKILHNNLYICLFFDNRMKREIKGRKKVEKRAISPVIATILLVLITVAAVAIIWAFVIPFIQNQISTLDCTSADIVFDETREVCYDEAQNLTVVPIKKGAGDVSIPRVQFIFSFADGDKSNTRLTELGANEGRIFYFKMKGEMPSKIAIAPLIRKGSKEKTCGVVSTVDVKPCTLETVNPERIVVSGWPCADTTECFDEEKTNCDGTRKICVLNEGVNPDPGNPDVPIYETEAGTTTITQKRCSKHADCTDSDKPLCDLFQRCVACNEALATPGENDGECSKKYNNPSYFCNSVSGRCEVNTAIQTTTTITGLPSYQGIVSCIIAHDDVGKHEIFLSVSYSSSGFTSTIQLTEPLEAEGQKFTSCPINENEDEMVLIGDHICNYEYSGNHIHGEFSNKPYIFNIEPSEYVIRDLFLTSFAEEDVQDRVQQTCASNQFCADHSNNVKSFCVPKCIGTNHLLYCVLVDDKEYNTYVPVCDSCHAFNTKRNAICHNGQLWTDDFYVNQNCAQVPPETSVVHSAIVDVLKQCSVVFDKKSHCLPALQDGSWKLPVIPARDYAFAGINYYPVRARFHRHDGSRNNYSPGLIRVAHPVSGRAREENILA